MYHFLKSAALGNDPFAAFLADFGSKVSFSFALHSKYHIFEFNLSKAYDECEGLEGVDLEHELLTRLAVHCLETGMTERTIRWKIMLYAFSTDPNGDIMDPPFSR